MSHPARAERLGKYDMINLSRWIYQKTKPRTAEVNCSTWADWPLYILFFKKTVRKANYNVYIALLANIPTQAESLLHCLEQAAGGIGPHFNPDRIEFMCFNQRGNISTLNGRYLKLVDKFTFSSLFSLKSKWCNYTVILAWQQTGRISVSFHPRDPI